jgi:hypothetical protein
LHGANSPTSNEVTVSNLHERLRSPSSNGPLNGAVTSSSAKLSNLLKAPPCPRCGAPMWLSRLEPHPTPDRVIDNMTYECACGEQFTRAVETR